MFVFFKEKLMLPKDDERGVYAVALVLLVASLIIAVGFAIDGPRLATANQRTNNVAEEAARYAASLFLSAESANVLSLEERFEIAEDGTRAFVATHSTSTFSISMSSLVCDVITGTLTVRVDGFIRNSLSGVFLGGFRRFDGQASADAVFVPPGGSVGGIENTINFCTGRI